MLCVAHPLHWVCETISVLYPNVEKLVSNGKRIFVKLTVTIQLCENNTPDTPLTPPPVTTFWVT
jgi:hypothetical protein